MSALGAPAAFLLAAVLTVQLLLAVRVVARLLRTAGGRRVQPCERPSPWRVTVIVPVLDERTRLSACLAGLVAQPAEVLEILVVDGGSRDGTRDLVRAWTRRDARVRLVDAAPLPPHWTGKAWSLAVGLRASSEAAAAVLCLDADVRVDPRLVRSLLAHLAATGDAAFSIATRQRLASAADALLHPSLLATLVYRFGIPGRATTIPEQVQANGQCFLARRAALLTSAAVPAAQDSLCEDVTIARALATNGLPVGFYEAGALATATMYTCAGDTWRNWPRSLALRDRFAGWRARIGLAELAFVQALPLPALLLAFLCGAPLAARAVEGALVALRLGVLAGMARAYPARPWTYWLSPLADGAVVYAIGRAARRARHEWRGRIYERVAPGRFRLVTRSAP